MSAETAWGVILGAVIGALINWFFAWRSSLELRRESEKFKADAVKLRKGIRILALGMEDANLAHFTWGPDDDLESVIRPSTGHAVGSSTSSGQGVAKVTAAPLYDRQHVNPEEA